MAAANVDVGFADGSAWMGVGMLYLLRQVLTMMLVSLLLPGLWLWVAFSNADRLTNGILS